MFWVRGHTHRTSRISKTVLPTVNLGPPEKNRTVHRAGDTFGYAGTRERRDTPILSPLYRPGLNGPKSAAHEYLSFPCLLCPSNEGS